MHHSVQWSLFSKTNFKQFNIFDCTNEGSGSEIPKNFYEVALVDGNQSYEIILEHTVDTKQMRWINGYCPVYTSDKSNFHVCI